jgi:hypothetical protein
MIDVIFNDICKFSKNIKSQRLLFYNDKITPNTICSGSYDNQPFFIDKNNKSIILFMNTEVEEYIEYFTEAISNKINKGPCFSYLLNPQKLKCIEWTNDESERYRKLSTSNIIENLKLI